MGLIEFDLAAVMEPGAPFHSQKGFHRIVDGDFFSQSQELYHVLNNTLFDRFEVQIRPLLQPPHGWTPMDTAKLKQGRDRGCLKVSGGVRRL